MGSAEYFDGPPALTPESQENEMISLAMERAREQLRAGTASSQIIAHFLKLGTIKSDLEKEKLKSENELLRAKVKSIESQQRNEDLYEDVLKAMAKYSGKEEYYDDIPYYE